jgi:hypothetical protein
VGKCSPALVKHRIGTYRSSCGGFGSGRLLERKSQFIQVDVMTKLDVLYRGKLVGYDLAADGSLVSLTLENAKKFKRQELLAARNKAPSKKINTALFWTPIEGPIFMLMAHEVVSLNLNYIDPAALQQTIAASISKLIANQVLDSIKAKRKARSSESMPGLSGRQRNKGNKP